MKIASALSSSIVLVTEAQQTQRAITALIGLLLVVAAMLAILTLWYWRHTSPRRRGQQRYVEVETGAWAGTYDDEFHSNIDDAYAGGRYFSPDEAVHVGDSYSDSHR